MNSQTIELAVKVWNLLKDESEFKQIPITDIASCLDLIKFKLLFDYSNKMNEVRNNQMEEFLKNVNQN